MELKESDRRVIDILKKRNLLSSTMEKSFIPYMEKWKTCAYGAALETRIIDESHLADIIAEEFGFERIFHLNQHAFPKDISKILEFGMAREWNCVPTLMTMDSGDIIFVTHNPIDTDFQREVASKLPEGSRFGVAEFREIKFTLHSAYPISCQLPSITEIS